LRKSMVQWVISAAVWGFLLFLLITQPGIIVILILLVGVPVLFIIFVVVPFCQLIGLIPRDGGWKRLKENKANERYWRKIFLEELVYHYNTQLLNQLREDKVERTFEEWKNHLKAFHKRKLTDEEIGELLLGEGKPANAFKEWIKYFEVLHKRLPTEEEIEQLLWQAKRKSIARWKSG